MTDEHPIERRVAGRPWAREGGDVNDYAIAETATMGTIRQYRQRYVYLVGYLFPLGDGVGHSFGADEFTADRPVTSYQQAKDLWTTEVDASASKLKEIPVKIMSVSLMRTEHVNEQGDVIEFW